MNNDTNNNINSDNKMKTIEATVLCNPTEVSRRLKISVAALRKYAALFEEVSDNPNLYEKTTQGARLYKPEDIRVLERFISLKKDGTVTLREAARQVLEVKPNSSDRVDLTEPLFALNEHIQALNKQSEVNKELSNQIYQLKEITESLAKSNVELSNQVKELLEAQKTANKIELDSKELDSKETDSKETDNNKELDTNKELDSKELNTKEPNFLSKLFNRKKVK